MSSTREAALSHSPRGPLRSLVTRGTRLPRALRGTQGRGGWDTGQRGCRRGGLRGQERGLCWTLASRAQRARAKALGWGQRRRALPRQRRAAGEWTAWLKGLHLVCVTGSRDLGGGGRQEAGARGTYRVLGRGARRHGEEELFPEQVRDPREARPWCGSVGTGPRVAGGVQRQADIGSGAQGPFWCACRGQLSCVFQGLTLGLAAVVQGPYKERRGVRGPRVLTDHRDTLLGDEVLPGSVPGPQCHSSALPTPAPTSSPPEPSLAHPAWTGFSTRHPVHLEAGDQPSGQQTNET